MDREQIKLALAEALKQGTLESIDAIPALQNLSAPVRSKLLTSGALPAVRLGGKWFSTTEVIGQALLANSPYFGTPKNPKGKKPVSNAHEQAVASLKAKGLL